VDDYYTTASAAQFLRCAPNTVIKYIEPAAHYLSTAGARRPLFSKAGLDAARELLDTMTKHTGKEHARA
jgi:hypothetical protein